MKFLAKLESKVQKIEDRLPLNISKSNLDSIIEELTNDIANSARLSKLTSKKISKSRLDFWTEELLQLKFKLRNAKEEAFETKNKSGKNNHKQLKAEYQRLLRRSKKEAFEKQCTVDMNLNPYKGLKKLAASQCRNDLPGELIINGESVTEKEVVVEKFWKSFFPRAKNKNMGPAQQNIIRNYKMYLKEPFELPSPPVTLSELKNCVYSIKNKAAPGTDGIGLDVIQAAYSIISNILLKLYNKCFELKHYPKVWKIEKETVLKKPNKPSYKDVKSFRPISVLNILGKIFEKIIHDRLTWIAEKQEWFGNNQHGFCKGKSTETAMHTLANIVEENVKNKVFTTVAFLDVSGAFDCRWPPAILAALAKYNCPKYLIGIIESLFENREASINVNDFIFKYIVSIGCPQRGILSPFLWKILAKQLINSVFHFKFKIIGYADDIALVAMHKILQISIANLQIMCNVVLKNCENVLLDINPLKSVLMIFCK